MTLAPQSTHTTLSTTTKIEEIIFLMSILSAVYYMLLSLISYLKINVATLALISHTLKMVRSHRNDAYMPHAM